MEKNQEGVTEPIIKLNQSGTDLVELFNLDRDRHDEIEMSMRKAMRKLFNDIDKGSPAAVFSSKDIIEALVPIAATPEELAFVMLQAGLKISQAKHQQDEILSKLGPLGDLISHLANSATKKTKHKFSNGDSIDDLLNKIFKEKGF